MHHVLTVHDMTLVKFTSNAKGWSHSLLALDHLLDGGALLLLDTDPLLVVPLAQGLQLLVLLAPHLGKPFLRSQALHSDVLKPQLLFCNQHTTPSPTESNEPLKFKQIEATSFDRTYKQKLYITKMTT